MTNAGIVSRGLAALVDMLVVVVTMGLLYLGLVLTTLIVNPTSFRFPAPNLIFSTAVTFAVSVLYRLHVTLWSLFGGLLTLLEKDIGDAVDFGTLQASVGQEGAPVVRLLQTVFEEAVRLRASDIHVEPQERTLRIRFRIDGVLYVQTEADVKIAPSVALRLKLMSGLDISEKRLPQDGRFNMTIRGAPVDVRISTLPSQYGESVVMRLLNQAAGLVSLDRIGLSDDMLTRLRRAAARPSGMILVTGPTGSGKTTTLYSVLAELNSTERKIITVEDPVEYRLAGINQVQVQEKIDLSFERVLRAALRQDPDVILVGEMRDRATAEIGMRASMTGHLVLSTLHTNTAAGAVIRLQDMGLERYLITSSVNGVLAQRLVRRLCTACKAPVDLDESVLERSGLKRFMGGSTRVYNPVGCPACRQTGYSGRTGIHELFVLGESMHQAIISGADATALHETARKSGMFTLYEDGLRKVAAGETSLEEVLRVTQDQGNA